MKNTKQVISLVLSFLLCLALSACNNKEKSSSPSPSTSPTVPPDLSGQWKQINSDSEDNYQGAIVDGDIIEIYWVSDGGDTYSLYWSGTYIAPATSEGPYSWESVNNKEKTAYALLASGDDSKTFTYDNGQISYSASALGSTSTIRMEKEVWNAGLKIVPAESEPAIDTPSPGNTDDNIVQKDESTPVLEIQPAVSQYITDSSSSNSASKKNETTYFPFSVGGIEFSVPSYYVMDTNESTSEGTAFSVSTGDPVQLILGQTECKNESAFDSAIEEMISSIGDGFEVSVSTDTSLAGLHGTSISASGESNSVSATISITSAYQPDIQKAILILFMSTGNLQYDYLADYNTLISTAKLAEPLPVNSVSGIRPEFKEAMDSFEIFFNEYVDFMQEFSNSSDTLSLLSAYTDYMAQYTETMDALSKLKESDMSKEENLYYLEVLSRITKKLSEIAQ